MPDLKTCPFCGGEAQEMFIRRKGLFPSMRFPYTTHATYIQCKTCHASSGVRYEKENAINAWNRRAGEEGEHELVESKV